MKYIKRYENNNSDIDIDYINCCFSDITDDNDNYNIDSGKDFWRLSIYNLPFVDIRDRDSISNGGISGLIDKFNEWAKYLEEIKSCIDKTRIEYPNLRESIYISDSGTFNITLFE